MNALQKVRIVLWTLAVVALGGFAAMAGGLLTISVPKPATVVVADKSTGVADVGGPFRLITHHGKPITDADLRGKPFLVFFGFTNCPDVCPTTMNELTGRFESLGADGDNIATLLVTVDPERDSQELLAQYMLAFDPRFLALRGTPEETAAMAKAYRAYVKKVATKDGDYTMDHAAVVYMMDRDGKFVGTLDPHEGEDVQLAKLRSLIGRRAGS